MATSPQMRDALAFSAVPGLRPDHVQELLTLQKAAKRISSILDLDHLIEDVVTDVARSFGCLEAHIYLRDESGQHMIVAGVHGCTSSRKGQLLKIGKDGMVGYVAGTGQMRYAPDVSKDPYFLACEPYIRSEVAIPLESNGEVIGVFTASHHELDAFPVEQIRLLQSLCSHIAVAVQNAQLFQRERRERERMSREAEEARLIQQALFPKSSPFIPGMKVSGASHPAGPVGGDWYDFIPLDRDRWGLVLADVSGKGTAAGLLMSATRGILRSLAEAACTPGEVLSKLNRLLVEDFPSGRFVTLVYGVLDPRHRTLTFANAGHVPPLLVNDCQTSLIETENGLPLGLALGAFSETTVKLPPGAKLIFYSDGITEAESVTGEEYGVRRLQDHSSSSDTTAHTILEDVNRFVAPAVLRDDATAIMVQT
ncbi:MAG: SpoIIE family protein phosphatase [Acidobacteria bacterium]|nr:SpoIIE family protein phosphatase [Acidobacteriota bacterium]